jgi:hypothetical protein
MKKKKKKPVNKMDAVDLLQLRERLDKILHDLGGEAWFNEWWESHNPAYEWYVAVVLAAERKISWPLLELMESEPIPDEVVPWVEELFDRKFNPRPGKNGQTRLGNSP